MNSDYCPSTLDRDADVAAYWIAKVRGALVCSSGPPVPRVTALVGNGRFTDDYVAAQLRALKAWEAAQDAADASEAAPVLSDSRPRRNSPEDKQQRSVAAVAMWERLKQTA